MPKPFMLTSIRTLPSATKKTIPFTLYCLITSSGFAALSWEIIWQLKSSLALGISALGTAMTLAIVMGGMSLGSFLMGKQLSPHWHIPPIRLYGLLEVVIGLAGLCLSTAFHWLESLDTATYMLAPSNVSWIYLLGMIIVCGIPTLCMGATLPVFGLIAKQSQVSIATLYGLNTFGAAIGVLAVAFIFIPQLGVMQTTLLIATLNIAVGVLTWLLPSLWFSTLVPEEKADAVTKTIPLPSLMVVCVSGFAIFTLEVAWFRSLSSVYANTSDVFAIILASTLIALALAAKKVPILKQRHHSLATQLCLAGVFILLITPVIERLDLLFVYAKLKNASHALPTSFSLTPNPDRFINEELSFFLYLTQLLIRFVVIFLLILLPLRYLGVVFPWMLDHLRSAEAIGKLYAANTLAAIAGSISAAWLFLPLLGFAKTAWIAGAIVILASLFLSVGRQRVVIGATGIVALLIALYFETGIGKTRIQGYFASDETGQAAHVLQSFEGPDATTSAVQYKDGTRALLINSTLATWESGRVARPSLHYMAWMGHLPMLLHPSPKDALVICFGTGQTANAVRKEQPQTVDIVDINPQVFKLAHYFKSNEGVLNNPSVNAIVMDGRSYLRRTQKKYDVITLEPMPPNNVGVNALYAREFYVLARNKLRANGIIAQWLPFHIVAPHYTASMVKTFIDVFPNAMLWIDEASKTGILLGFKQDSMAHPTTWPGFARTPLARNLSYQAIQQSIALNASELASFAAVGEMITDDNQLLAYGKVLYPSGLLESNFKRLQAVNPNIAMPAIDARYR